jgi:hypothetical protein
VSFSIRLLQPRRFVAQEALDHSLERTSNQEISGVMRPWREGHLVTYLFLTWAVAISIALHNTEEAVWLPAWSQSRAGRWHRPVTPRSFRFAVAVLTLVAFAVAAWAHARGPGSLGHQILAAYALGQGANVFLPHVVATVATRTYAPGLLTGLFLVLPSTSAFLIQSFTSQQLSLGRFLLVAAVFIPVMLLSIPLLFKVGASSLRTVKLVHTIVWAFFASSIAAIPVLAAAGRYPPAFIFIGIVFLEVLVLLLNRWRCPLTNVAARYTDDRRDNFDIYLPEWLARHNKLIFGLLYVLGSLFAVARWALWFAS